MRVIQLIGLFAAFIFVLTVGFFLYAYLYYDPIVSNQQKLLNYKDQGIILADRNNIPYYSINNAVEDDYVPLDEISPNIINAVIAQEDREFYNHNGISFRGMTRSLILNIKEGRMAYGGSTITQQLVKNALLSSKKSISRKAQEALLAFDIEANYEKDKIMEMYLNTVYYGEGAIGIGAASKTYFDKKPKDLTIPEAAYMAGMLKYPNLLSPYTGDEKMGLTAQKNVITKMEKMGTITKEQAQAAKREKLTFRRGTDGFDNLAPHYALMVVDRLKELFGNDVVYDGYKVKTSLDYDLQKFAQQIVKENVEKNRTNGVSNGAIVSMDPATGEILALVGSADWYNEHYGKVNMATSPRQPGSSFKPIVYSLAMDEGIITPATVLRDTPKTFVLDSNCSSNQQCIYKPQNFDRKFRGPVTVRRALANSLNVPAVEVMEKLGIDDLLMRAPSFGISTLKDAQYYGKGLSLVLGSAEISPFEMTSAFSTFANKGVRTSPVLILEVKDKYEKVVYENQPISDTVIGEDTAYLINSILSDSNARREQFGTILNTPFTSAVKTGTTENFRDAWTIGYTPNFVTAVWVGNNDSTPIRNLTGSLAAAPIWKAIMTKYSEKVAYTDFARPDGIVLANSCEPQSSSSARVEYFRVGTQPKRTCRTERIPDNISSSDNKDAIGGDFPTPTPIPTQDNQDDGNNSQIELSTNAQNFEEKKENNEEEKDKEKKEKD